jgi:hypothetical protein
MCYLGQIHCPIPHEGARWRACAAGVVWGCGRSGDGTVTRWGRGLRRRPAVIGRAEFAAKRTTGVRVVAAGQCGGESDAGVARTNRLADVADAFTNEQ